MIIQRIRKRFYLILSYLLTQKQYWNVVGQIFPLDAILDGYFNKDLFFKTGRETVNFFKKEKLINKRSTTLHIGCGIGRIEKNLATSVKKCYGVDISNVMIHQAKQYTKYKNCEFIATNGEELPFSDNYFEFIYSLLVFQHMPTKVFIKYLNEVQRTLKSKGKFLFQIPLDEKNQMKKPNWNNPWLMRYYKRTEIQKLLVQRKLKVVKVFDNFSQDTKKDYVPNFIVLAIKQ